MSISISTVKKIITTFSLTVFIFSTLIFVLTPVVSFAQVGNPGGQIAPGDPGGQIAPGDPGGQLKKIKLENPLNVNSIEELIGGILNIVLILAVPVIVFFIIYAGFLYATARGNAEQVKKATTALTYAIIGGVLIIGSVAIAEIVKQLVLSFKA